MKKKLMLLVAMLALALTTAAPVMAQVNAPVFDDQEFESGEIETATEISIDGNNNNQCVGALQFGNTGNFANQQGFTQYDLGEAENELEGPEIEFAPENATECEQAVQQSLAASSWGW
jgi:protein involved in sex pheromone biosynthesis